MKYTISRLIELEHNTLKEADRIIPNYQTGMDILREDAREEEREIIAMVMIRRGAEIDTISEFTRLNPNGIYLCQNQLPHMNWIW